MTFTKLEISVKYCITQIDKDLNYSIGGLTVWTKFVLTCRPGKIGWKNGGKNGIDQIFVRLRKINVTFLGVNVITFQDLLFPPTINEQVNWEYKKPTPHALAVILINFTKKWVTLS